MTKYICEICNYSSDRSSDLVRHKNSKKHKISEATKNMVIRPLSCVIQKLPDSYHENQRLLCKFCNKEFKYKSGLSRHQNERCKEKIEKNVENLELKEQNKKLINTIENQSKIAKKSMNVLSYALNNFHEAPPVGLLEDDKFDTMTKCLIYDDNGNKKTSQSVEEIIIYHHKKDTLVKVLGELLINEYKKKNPNSQSIWSSDISRLTFIVKDIIGKTKKSKWITDKKGLHITQTIINPMMKIIKEKLTKYVGKSGRKVDRSMIKDEEEIKEVLSKMHDANLAILTIKLGKIHGDILKQIAPHFNLDMENISDNSDMSDSNSDN